MELKDIKNFTAKWKDKLKTEVSALPQAPNFAIIQIGNIEASNRYVKNKIKDCEYVGINTVLRKFDESITTMELVKEVVDLSKNNDAIMIQLPIPEHIDLSYVLNYLPDNKDVDGMKITSKFNPCTPGGIMKYLEHCECDLDGMNVLVIGRSNIVGKPMARMLTDANATVTLAHSHTKHIHNFINSADLIITAVGKPNFLNCYPIRVPVIDVGINFNDEGKMVGDCFNTEHAKVTPVPGGVGLLTRCMLLDNIVHKGEK